MLLTPLLLAGCMHINAPEHMALGAYDEENITYLVLLSNQTLGTLTLHSMIVSDGWFIETSFRPAPEVEDWRPVDQAFWLDPMTARLRAFTDSDGKLFVPSTTGQVQPSVAGAWRPAPDQRSLAGVWPIMPQLAALHAVDNATLQADAAGWRIEMESPCLENCLQGNPGDMFAIDPWTYHLEGANPSFFPRVLEVQGDGWGISLVEKTSTFAGEFHPLHAGSGPAVQTIPTCLGIPCGDSDWIDVPWSAGLSALYASDEWAQFEDGHPTAQLKSVVSGHRLSTLDSITYVPGQDQWTLVFSDPDVARIFVFDLRDDDPLALGEPKVQGGPDSYPLVDGRLGRVAALENGALFEDIGHYLVSMGVDPRGGMWQFGALPPESMGDEEKRFQVGFSTNGSAWASFSAVTGRPLALDPPLADAYARQFL